MRISDYFSLGKSQSEIDFVDVPIDGDLSIFVDPFALSLEQSPWFQQCSFSVITFFQAVLDAISSGSDRQAMTLLSRLQEPNEVHLGLSSGQPAGRGVGIGQAGSLLSRLKSSNAVRSGDLADLEDSELIIDGVGPDKISDITINVIRDQLVQYTAEQCHLHGISLSQRPLPPAWNPNTLRWEARYRDLPSVGDAALVLVPKSIVRRTMSIDHHRFYATTMTDYLVQEHLDSGSSLRDFLVDGTPVVRKGVVRKRNPISKQAIYDFTQAHPSAIPEYKTLAARQDRPMTNDAIEDRQPAPQQPRPPSELVSELRLIPPGNATANTYHEKIIDVVEAIFYPEISNMVKEQEVNEGRKRIDFTFSPIVQAKGFFSVLGTRYKIFSPIVFGEAKNYSNDIGNKELDQMIGRFSNVRGKFGMVFIRNVDDRETLTRRCHDAVTDGQGHILVLTDNDLAEIAVAAERSGTPGVDEQLQRRLHEILLV